MPQRMPRHPLLQRPPRQVDPVHHHINPQRLKHRLILGILNQRHRPRRLEKMLHRLAHHQISRIRPGQRHHNIRPFRPRRPQRPHIRPVPQPRHNPRPLRKQLTPFRAALDHRHFMTAIHQRPRQIVPHLAAPDNYDVHCDPRPCAAAPFPPPRQPRRARSERPYPVSTTCRMSCKSPVAYPITFSPIAAYIS